MAMRLLTACLALLLGASCALADEKADEKADETTTDKVQAYDELFSLSLGQLVNIQVTSSTLTTKDLKTVPASVTVFNRSQIRNLGTEYLHELINYVPGFQSYRQGESSMEYFHSARGHRTSVSSREVLILVDGARINREFDNASSVPMLSLHNVEKIEFVRGPGSALYGSNAFLGVIDITTVKQKNEIAVAGGDFGKKSLSAIGSLAVAGFQIDAAGYAFDEDGEQFTLQNFFTAAAEQWRDSRAGEDLQLTIKKEGTLFSANYFNREAEDFYIAERVSDDRNLVEHRRENYRLQQRVNWLQSFYSDITFSYGENRFTPETYFGTALGQAEAEQKETNQEARWHNHWGIYQQWSLQFGLEYRHSDILAFDFLSENVGSIEFYPDATQESTGAYLQSQHEFGAGSELVLGARYDTYNGIGSSLSPRFGLVTPLTKNQTVKLLYGEAFRAPTINERYLQTFSGGLAGNPNLEPETINTWEAIWIGQWQDVSVTVNTFYNVLEDTIVRNDSQIPNFTNSASDESFYGAELEYAFQLTSHWLFKANASHMRNLPGSDFREADWLGSVVVNYSKDRWNLSLSSTYADEREMLVGAETVPLDSYWVVDSKVQYQLDGDVIVYLAATDLFNESFETPTQRSTLTEPVPNRGRELTLGLSATFN